MKASLGFATVLLAFSHSASAYNTELDFTYGRIADVVDTAVLSARYYFSPVEPGKGPLEEAAFMQQSANVFLSYTELDLFLDTSELRLGVEGYMGENKGFFGRVGIRSTKVSGFGFGATDTGAFVAVGVAPLPGLLMFTEYDTEIDYELNFDIQYVKALDTKRAYRIELDYDAGGDGADDNYAVTGTYFPDPTLGVGVILERVFGESAVGVQVEKFFTPTFAAGALYQRVESENIWALNAKVRF